MGNSLLDFVMSLVRDPQAAAQYAADPSGVLAAAGLPGVTITDVQNLIPVVADSLATATPSFGDVFDAANVWTSGAAAAALDAFHVPHPAPVVHDPLPQVAVAPIDAPVVDSGTYPAVDAPIVDPTPALDPAAALDHPLPDPAATDWTHDGGRHQTHDLQPDHLPADHPGFDLF